MLSKTNPKYGLESKNIVCIFFYNFQNIYSSPYLLSPFSIDIIFCSKMIFSEATSNSSCKWSVDLILLVNIVLLFDGNPIMFAFEDR